MTTDATIVLGALTMGTGTPYAIDVDGIAGLGVPDTKTADTVFDGRDGAFAAPDFLSVRVVTIPIVILGSSPDDAFDGLAALNTAWGPARDGVDLTLVLTLPGWGTVNLIGRPRGVVADTKEMKNSTIRALCRFDGMDPNFGA